ncbi:MAG: DUF2723 domain-containing protein [Verrucomicrobiota bacterium]
MSDSIQRFYSRRDWLAGGIAWAVAFAGYLWTLAPSVTLEDSGEFLTAAYNLGVPHPPGYPIWTMLAWLWCHLVPVGNIGWRGNLMSAFFSTLACGLVALLVSKSGRVLVQKVDFLQAAVSQRLMDLIVLASAICAGLLLAFSPVMWSQGIITEVYGLNACLFLATLVVLYRWSFEPEKRWRLYLAALIWGVGLTAHQTLVLLTVAFPTFIWFTDRKFGRNVLVPVLLVAALGLLGEVKGTWTTLHKLEEVHDQAVATGNTNVASPWDTYKFPLLVYIGLVAGAGYWLYLLLKDRDWRGPALTLLGVVALGGVFGGLALRYLENDARGVWLLLAGILAMVGLAGWIYAGRHGPTEDVRHASQALLVYVAVCLGLSLYGYLYFSSCTNPPMNWGHCSQWEGFKHHFTRGQYDKIHLDRTFLQFWGQLNMFFDDLQWQFNIVYALLALFALFFFRDLGDSERNWLRFLFIGFLCLGIGFIFLSNPTFEKQKQFTDRVFFLPCHCIYSLWIGYGLILGLGYLFTEKPALQRAAAAVAVVVLVLPAGSWWRNWRDQEQRGHDFGYRFGYLMFKPGGDYPEMDRDAVLYGGTDPGRFVPTYMIFVESFATAKTHSEKCPDSATFDRRDVYIITQNALADTTYMAYIRDHYDFSRPRSDAPLTLTNRSGLYRGLLGHAATYPKQPIWIPSEQDSQLAFGRYVEELKTRAPMPGEDVRVENGHVSVQGVAGVMAINGYLTKDIFEHNKDNHSFYVEESYVIQWMYPYLEPFGIILKINSNPLPAITPAMVARDTAYWNALAADLSGDPKFHRDDVAQKTFSKLRSAIGGVYAYRHMISEAEAAFTQAIGLCPDSPEANYRLAQLYIEQRRFDAAISVLENYQKHDSFNPKIREAIEQVKKMRDDLATTADLEKQLLAQPGNIQVAMQLARALASGQRLDAFDNLVNQLVTAPDLPQADYLTLINYYAQLNRGERVLTLLSDFTRRYPQNALGWYNYSCVLSLKGNCLDGMAALSRALQLDGPERQIHLVASQDKRFANCRNSPQFQQLMGGAGTPVTTPSNLPFRLTQ